MVNDGDKPGLRGERETKSRDADAQGSGVRGVRLIQDFVVTKRRGDRESMRRSLNHGDKRVEETGEDRWNRDTHIYLFWPAGSTGRTFIAMAHDTCSRCGGRSVVLVGPCSDDVTAKTEPGSDPCRAVAATLVTLQTFNIQDCCKFQPQPRGHLHHAHRPNSGTGSTTSRNRLLDAISPWTASPRC